jgi:hypothetical protein
MFQQQASLLVSFLLLGAHATDPVDVVLLQQKAEMMSKTMSSSEEHPTEASSHHQRHGGHRSDHSNHHGSEMAQKDHHQPQKGSPPISHLSQKRGSVKICKELVKAPAGASYKFKPEIPAESMCCDGLSEGKNMWIQWGFQVQV